MNDVVSCDVAWAIGLFEGEGTIASDERGGRVAIRFILATTDRDVLDRFVAIVDCGWVRGPLHHAGGTKPIWEWGASAQADVAHVSDLFAAGLGERRRNALERAWHRFATQPAKDPRAPGRPLRQRQRV